ncbi:EamA family transporter [Candidatus Woesearchaeota archaeon]|nr:EamA family transporter [Candidatus Woesearchaeota archaeon]
MINIIAILLVSIATLIGSAGALFLKLGSAKVKFSIKELIKNFNLLLGLFLYCFSTIFYIISLKMGELTIIYPLTSLSYIWTALLSKKFLKEKLNIFKWTGILLIIAGIYFIVR